MINEMILKNKNEMIDALSKLIQKKSVRTAAEGNMPFGRDIQMALEYFLALGESMGFTTKNIDNYAGYIEYGTGDEMLGILCHLDVVPEGENWSYPPFSGTVTDDKIYGRGAIDNKGPAIASLYAMKALKDSGYVPNKRIRLICGTNEESGSACIAHYIAHEEIPTLSFSPDADFPVIHGEMGIAFFDLVSVFTDKVPDDGVQIISLEGGKAPNMVPDHAEVLLSDSQPIKHILDAFNETKGTRLAYEALSDKRIKLTSHGISAHGSTPEKGLNAISQLITYLELIDLQVGDAANFIRFLARNIGMDTTGERMGVDFKDAYNPLVLNLGVIKMDENQGKATINIRYPITLEEETLHSAIAKSVEGTSIKIENWFCAKPLYFEPTHPLVETLMKVYREKTGDYEAKPITIGGGTYARALPNAVAFGALFPNQEDTMHQKDEYMAIDAFMTMTEIYAQAMVELT